MDIAPRCRVAYNNLLLRAGLARTLSLLPEKTYIRYFPGNIVYVNKVRGTNLEDVLIYTLGEDRVNSYVRAETGTMSIDPANNVLTVRLFNLNRIFFTQDRNVPQLFSSGEWEFSYTNVAARMTRKLDVTDMTFQQLREERRNLEQALSLPAFDRKAGAQATHDKTRQAGSPRKKDLAMPIEVQLHRQVAFSFACVAFTLVGIPLGIRAHRRETTFGVAVALLLVLVYYSFFVIGQALNTRQDLAPHLILWMANFLFQAVGIVLLWRANRGI
jgi:lipopolysaccharide export system permease protein